MRVIWLMPVLLAGCLTVGGPPTIPAPRDDPRPLPPVSAVELIWQPGHWDWNGSGYVWAPGQWVPAAGHGRTWVEGGWSNADKSWRWMPPHWQD